MSLEEVSKEIEESLAESCMWVIGYCPKCKHTLIDPEESCRHCGLPRPKKTTTVFEHLPQKCKRTIVSVIAYEQNGKRFVQIIKGGEIQKWINNKRFVQITRNGELQKWMIEEDSDETVLKLIKEEISLMLESKEKDDEKINYPWGERCRICISEADRLKTSWGPFRTLKGKYPLGEKCEKCLRPQKIEW